jgi:hypothetical protein
MVEMAVIRVVKEASIQGETRNVCVRKGFMCALY